MTKNILFIDKKWQVSTMGIVLEHNLDLHYNIIDSLEDAMKSLKKIEYDCVIIEPLNYTPPREECDVPFLNFVRTLTELRIPLIIGSAYTEKDFNERFNVVRGDYIGYQQKPWSTREFTQEIERVLREGGTYRAIEELLSPE